MGKAHLFWVSSFLIFSINSYAGCGPQGCFPDQGQQQFQGAPNIPGSGQLDGQPGSLQQGQRVITEPVAGLSADFHRVCDQSLQTCSFTLRGNPLDIAPQGSPNQGLLTVTDASGTHEPDDGRVFEGGTIAKLFNFYSNNWRPTDGRNSLCNVFLDRYRPKIQDAINNGQLPPGFGGGNPPPSPSGGGLAQDGETPQGPTGPPDLAGTDSATPQITKPNNEAAPEQNPHEIFGTDSAAANKRPSVEAPKKRPTAFDTAREIGGGIANFVGQKGAELLKKLRDVKKAERDATSQNFQEKCNVADSQFARTVESKRDPKNRPTGAIFINPALLACTSDIGNGVSLSREFIVNKNDAAAARLKEEVKEIDPFFAVHLKDGKSKEIDLHKLLLSEGETLGSPTVSHFEKRDSKDNAIKTRLVELTFHIKKDGTTDTREVRVLVSIGDTPEEICIAGVHNIKPYSAEISKQLEGTGQTPDEVISHLRDGEMAKLDIAEAELLASPPVCAEIKTDEIKKQALKRPEIKVVQTDPKSKPKENKEPENKKQQGEDKPADAENAENRPQTIEERFRVVADRLENIFGSKVNVNVPLDPKKKIYPTFQIAAGKNKEEAERIIDRLVAARTKAGLKRDDMPMFSDDKGNVLIDGAAILNYKVGEKSDVKDKTFQVLEAPENAGAFKIPSQAFNELQSTIEKDGLPYHLTEREPGVFQLCTLNAAGVETYCRGGDASKIKRWLEEAKTRKSTKQVPPVVVPKKETVEKPKASEINPQGSEAAVRSVYNLLTSIKQPEKRNDAFVATDAETRKNFKSKLIADMKLNANPTDLRMSFSHFDKDQNAVFKVWPDGKTTAGGKQTEPGLKVTLGLGGVFGKYYPPIEYDKPGQTYSIDSLDRVGEIIKRNRTQGITTKVLYAAKDCGPCQARKPGYYAEARTAPSNVRYYVYELNTYKNGLAAQNIPGLDVAVGGIDSFPSERNY